MAGSTAPATLGSRDVLRLPDFRRLWAAQGISDIGDGLTMLTLMLLVNQLTGLHPGPRRRRDRAGHPAADDRARRRDLRGPLGPAPDHARLGQPARRGRPRLRRSIDSAAMLPALLVLAFVQASIGTFFTPARGALVPRVVPAEGLLAANAITQATRVIAGVVGRGLAGLIVGVLGADVAGVRPRRRRRSCVGAHRVRRGPSGRRSDRSRPCRRRRRGRLAHARGCGSWPAPGAVGRRCPRSAMAMFGLGAINVLFLPLLVDVLGVSPAWLGAVDPRAERLDDPVGRRLVGVLAARFRPQAIVTGGLMGLGILLALDGPGDRPDPRPRAAVPHGLARHARPGGHRDDHADRRRRCQPRAA